MPSLWSGTRSRSVRGSFATNIVDGGACMIFLLLSFCCTSTCVDLLLLAVLMISCKSAPLLVREAPCAGWVSFTVFILFCRRKDRSGGRATSRRRRLRFFFSCCSSLSLAVGDLPLHYDR